MAMKSHSDPDFLREQGSFHNRVQHLSMVLFDRTTIDVDGKPGKLMPGMAATVEIKTGKRKMIEFLLSPLMRMTGEAGKYKALSNLKEVPVLTLAAFNQI
jgi:hypothetical protein